MSTEQTEKGGRVTLLEQALNGYANPDKPNPWVLSCDSARAFTVGREMGRAKRKPISVSAYHNNTLRVLDSFGDRWVFDFNKSETLPEFHEYIPV